MKDDCYSDTSLPHRINKLPERDAAFTYRVAMTRLMQQGKITKRENHVQISMLWYLLIRLLDPQAPPSHGSGILTRFTRTVTPKRRDRHLQSESRLELSRQLASSVLIGHDGQKQLGAMVQYDGEQSASGTSPLIQLEECGVQRNGDSILFNPARPI
ncbi:hypothetical protein S7711_11354 [Stachybotrys chartarum IBT 7711]|uniref:Uncharacterized protein n=1 Tax=Stachybotrys chartarum (strain CBS 109288 / IBT 7711) TaxID=1280523 RepID=A0A084ASC0_STACB|nr:hypothetical protein S7711_11354 [Stachybotrys chartarum IBT 7711]